MNITQVISSIDKNAGGTSAYIKLLVESLVNESQQNIIAFDSESNINIDPRVNTQVVQPNKWSQIHSEGIKQNLQQSNAHIFHGHGLWQHPVHAMSRHAQKQNIPYIISTHGMLEPWSLTQSKFKKSLALKIFQASDLKKATCLHATAPMEVENLRALGYQNPIAMIPNGIHIDEYPLKKYDKSSKSKRKILFLSRIHPKKGIEILIAAWESINLELKQKWHIEIAGNGEDDYISQLHKLIKSKGLENEIKILGPKFGKGKVDLYQSADLFVLPTYSENFGIVIAEALSCGVPVITTKGTPWEDLQTSQSGWWIEIGAAPLQRALEDALHTPDTTLQKMGQNGRQLVEDNYSIEAVAQQMLELYEWVLSERAKPEFINIM